jgi:hypothetical protein
VAGAKTSPRFTFSPSHRRLVSFVRLPAQYTTPVTEAPLKQNPSSGKYLVLTIQRDWAIVQKLSRISAGPGKRPKEFIHSRQKAPMEKKNHRKEVDLFLFDLDGTLSDSRKTS